MNYNNMQYSNGVPTGDKSLGFTSIHRARQTQFSIGYKSSSTVKLALQKSTEEKRQHICKNMKTAKA